jgi:6-phosphofructokinase
MRGLAPQLPLRCQRLFELGEKKDRLRSLKTGVYGGQSVMGMASSSNETERVGILVGGGPAPGINGTIGAVTLEAANRGVGIYDGFSHLMAGRIDRIKMLDHDDVSRTHFEGGSILATSRANPTQNAADLERVIGALKAIGIRYLVTIGGDDTMYAASQVAKASAGQIRVCHVPKTIDNDLPLPGETPTFGFETAVYFSGMLIDARRNRGRKRFLGISYGSTPR